MKKFLKNFFSFLRTEEVPDAMLIVLIALAVVGTLMLVSGNLAGDRASQLIMSNLASSLIVLFGIPILGAAAVGILMTLFKIPKYLRYRKEDRLLLERSRFTKEIS
ncbi:hypothetical protein KW782_00285 [Candidatus Parcubacteria bacterium]|nr:hypothetical protein [Candidatus Parcubacteria bacterium]